MLSYPSRWLPTAALVLAYLTQGAHTTVVSLLDLMPKCASECLESFISTEYPRNACSTGCDLNYLCTRNTTSGYTLGEGALRCSLSMCSMEVAMSFDTYSICESVPGALPRTHPTIVATIVSPGDSTSSTTRPTTIVTAQPETTDTRPTAGPTSTKTDHTSTTTTFQSPVSATDSAQDPSSTETKQPTSTTSSDSSPSETSSETSSAASEGSGLNSGAVIGVSVASGLAGFFIIGVIIFFCHRKIRRKNAQNREFFEIGGHMSEPPDFSFPPRRPPMGPRPSPGSLAYDSESARLVPPVEPEYQHPAVIVTEPQAECLNEHVATNNTDRVAFHPSSHLEFDAASTASSRTVSDLLPDKPTYELYPRPLRWSQHKKRPSSGATSFEEENHMAGPRNLPSPSLQHFDFTGGTSRGHNRLPMAGLPANPRAMMYGFGRDQSSMPPMKGPGHGKKPIYANAKEKLQPSRQAAIHEGASPYMSGQTDYNDDIDNYWQSPDAGFVGAKVIEPHGVAPRGSYHESGANRNSFGDYRGYNFESQSLDTNDNYYLSPESRQASRHSGSFRPLTPVREIRTPTGELQQPIYPPGPSSGPLNNQAQEIISRPRIIRQDDIKRVQIRRGKPSPKEMTAPYCPDDYWLEQSNEPPSGYSAPRLSGEYKYISGGNIGRMPKKKPSPLERNLTPSRRGADLILQVE